MKIIEFLRNIKFTVSGSFAIYFIMCAGYVTVVGMYGIGSFILKVIKKLIA